MTSKLDFQNGPFGYSLPLSPRGFSSMLTQPPWHFAGEVIMVNVRVNPLNAAAFLPNGLELGSDPGAAAFIFAEWNWCSVDGKELGDPSSCQFSEFLILLACQFKGQQLARCPYAWVNRPIPMMRGWLQGMPKQFGEIYMTHTKRVGKVGPAPGGAGRYVGSLSVAGKRIVELSVEATKEVRERPLLHNVPLVHSLVQPQWTAEESVRNVSELVHPLVMSTVEAVEFSDILDGHAELSLFPGLDEDFYLLKPVAVGRGYVFDYAETLTGGRPLM